jgi:hypothetical protein
VQTNQEISQNPWEKREQPALACSGCDDNEPRDNPLDGANAGRLPEEDGVEDHPGEHARGGSDVGLHEISKDSQQLKRLRTSNKKEASAFVHELFWPEKCQQVERCLIHAIVVVAR